ncbi:glycosyltransferase family 92 domain-containing protein [Phthorimaea operculella]|nr:glycosyltransferase family 92 domain-containing protein [Phthorimaea operculella]
MSINWFRFYVYSAWVERRTVGAVRVIAATKTRGSDAVICRLWLNNNRTVTLKAKVQAIRENWNLKYSAMYVLCLLRDSGVKPQDTVGASIAVISAFAPNRPSTNLLIVKSTEPEEGIQDKLYICVKPFHFLYNRDQWLIEWMEVNRLLGVSHFLMYNKTVSPRVGCVLEHYQRQGLVTLLPWKLPILSKVEIRTEGQFAAFNDCLYRSMSKAAWLMPIDTDEVVFPRRTHTIPEMLSTFAATIKLPSKTPAAFLFRNAFFYTQWKDDPEAPSPLLTARKTRRLTTPHALKNRSKYVVRPRDVVELGNHFVWEHAPGANSVGVPIENALLHHYRVNCEFDGVECLKLPSTIDRTAHAWATKELYEAVQLKQKVIDEECS